jgi:hypothetical protein
MDMIEYAIFCLARQAEGISEIVPNDAMTKTRLRAAGKALDAAAGNRHSWRHEHTDELDDDYAEAQRAQLVEVEDKLAQGGVGLLINKVPALTKEEFEREMELEKRRLLQQWEGTEEDRRLDELEKEES